MAIAYDNSTWIVATTGATTLSSTNHLVTGSNTILFAGLWSSVALSSVAATYNGASLNILGTVSGYNGTEKYVYAINSPTTGSSLPIVFTWASSSGIKAIYTSSYTGVSQVSLPSVTQNRSGTATSLSASITTDSTANSWVLLFGRNESNDFTTGTNTTWRAKSNNFDAIGIGDSGGTVPTSSSFTMQSGWTGSASTQWGSIQVEFNPAVAVNNGNFLTFM